MEEIPATVPERSERLKAGLRRLFRRRTRAAISLDPGCPFGAVLGERLQALQRSVDEVKARLNGLLFLVTGAVLMQVLLRLFNR